MHLLDYEQEKDFYEEESDAIIMQISEDIVLDNMIEQIRESNNLSKYDLEKSSFFEYFEKRFNFIIDRYEESTDIVRKCKAAYDEILNQILSSIDEVYNISIEFNEIILIEKKAEYTKALYYFFVINQKENIENLLVNIIQKNSEDLIKLTSEFMNKEIEKSLSYVNLKKIIDNKYTPLIFFINEIINNIEVKYNEDVLEMMIGSDEDELTNFYIDRLLIEQSVADINFEKNLMEILLPNIVENNKNLRRAVQNKLITMYK